MPTGQFFVSHHRPVFLFSLTGYKGIQLVRLNSTCCDHVCFTRAPIFYTTGRSKTLYSLTTVSMKTAKMFLKNAPRGAFSSWSGLLLHQTASQESSEALIPMHLQMLEGRGFSGQGGTRWLHFPVLVT